MGKIAEKEELDFQVSNRLKKMAQVCCPNRDYDEPPCSNCDGIDNGDGGACWGLGRAQAILLAMTDPDIKMLRGAMTGLHKGESEGEKARKALGYAGLVTAKLPKGKSNGFIRTSKEYALDIMAVQDPDPSSE